MINDDVKLLVKGRSFATISRFLPSGQIQTNVVWANCDAHVAINTEVALRKFNNARVYPCVTVAAWV
jgi:hypothetical protein